MRDHYDCASLGQGFQRFLDKSLVFRIGKRRCLVKHDDRRIFQYGASNRNTLSFTARKHFSTFTDLCLYAVRQALEARTFAAWSARAFAVWQDDSENTPGAERVFLPWLCAMRARFVQE